MKCPYDEQQCEYPKCITRGHIEFNPECINLNSSLPKENSMKYQLTFTRYNTDKSGVSFTETFNSDNLVEMLSRLPLAVATVCKLEEDSAIREVYRKIDDDIPF